MFYYGWTVLLNRLFGLLPLQKNRVLFLSDVREDLSGNFRYVRDALPKGYEVRMSLKADRRIRRPLREYLRQCLDLATCGTIFLDDFAECTAFMHVRKGQELVQLWHGSGAYKKFGHSRSGNENESVRIHPGYKRYTKAIVSSDKIRSCYAEAFALPPERVLATGIPRTDAFFDNGSIAGFREAFYVNYPEIAGKKVILFAPTYRGERVEDASYDFSALRLDVLYEALHEEYVLLVKWHPAIQNNLRNGKIRGWDPSLYEGFVYDLSDIREVNDLLFVTDLLVTDYSSVIFDYALLEKPIIFFCYDLAQYRDGRGLYFPFEEYVYGAVASDTRELVDAVREEAMCRAQREIFREKFIDANDGHASQRLTEAVFGTHR